MRWKESGAALTFLRGGPDEKSELEEGKWAARRPRERDGRGRKDQREHWTRGRRWEYRRELKWKRDEKGEEQRSEEKREANTERSRGIKGQRSKQRKRGETAMAERKKKRKVT